MACIDFLHQPQRIYTAQKKSLSLLFGFTGSEARKIGGSHGGDYEEWRLLGCYAVWLL
jgi:hypothetical protein